MGFRATGLDAGQVLQVRRRPVEIGNATRFHDLLAGATSVLWNEFSQCDCMTECRLEVDCP